MMSDKYNIPYGAYIKYAPACDDIYDFLGSFAGVDDKK